MYRWEQISVSRISSFFWLHPFQSSLAERTQEITTSSLLLLYWGRVRQEHRRAISPKDKWLGKDPLKLGDYHSHLPFFSWMAELRRKQGCSAPFILSSNTNRGNRTSRGNLSVLEYGLLGFWTMDMKSTLLTRPQSGWSAWIRNSSFPLLVSFPSRITWEMDDSNRALQAMATSISSNSMAWCELSSTKHPDSGRPWC